MTRLGRLLRQHRESILRRWLESARERNLVPDGLSRELPVDDMPGLLEDVSAHVDRLASDPHARLRTAHAEAHASQRLAEGVDLHEVVLELSALRECILREWRERCPEGGLPEEPDLVSRSVDEAIAAAVARYTESRDRVLHAFDRISAAALESRGLQELLQRLLEVLLNTAPTVDAGAILLRHRDELTVKAAAGLSGSITASGGRIRIGEGFAGRIASEARPRLLTGADLDREPDAAGVGRPLRAVYGIPLVNEGRLIGVAHLGSSSSPDLSADERFLLHALGDRATAGIVQHQLREAVERNAAELAAVVESIPEPVVVADHSGLRTANRAALRLLGLPSVEEASRRAPTLGVLFEARELATGAPVPLELRPLRRALAGETVRQELAVRRADSREELIVRAEAAPVVVRGAVVAAVLVVSDLTQQRRAEQERERLLAETRQAVADRKHVLAVVSHDLRSPLGAIVSAAALFDQPATDDLRARGVAMIRRSAARMNRMVQDLLDVGSIEAGRLSVDPRPLQAATVVDEAVEAARAEAAESGCAVVADVEPELPLVRGDRDRLAQLIGNLIGNAMKVTPREGRITVAARACNGGVLYAVQDTGPGIAPEMREKLFQPYWRGTPGYKGSGLGLAIAHGIVEAHGGRIWIDSEPGRGTTVSFTVPAA